MSNTPLPPADKILKIGNDIDGNIEYVYYWHEESMHAHAAAVSAADNTALRERIKVLDKELREVLEWAIKEKAPLRDQEIRSIRAALGDKT